MFESAETLLLQFVDWFPYLIPIILLFNLISDILFGGSKR